MSKQYPGGLITKTPVTPTGPYQNGTASGVWTLNQQAKYQQQGIWPTAGLTPNYIEDVFSTYLYTGTGSAQTITNGINLSGQGGLVWTKARDTTTTSDNTLNYNSSGGYVTSNNTSASGNSGNSWNSTGFNVGPYLIANTSGINYVSWTFRKQPKFFDVVTYTGDGTAGKTIAHSLGSVPGCIIVKATNTAMEWAVYHTSLGATQYMSLNTTDNVTASLYYWNNTTPTSSVFTVGDSGRTNGAGNTYVAYIFASNAGGFGATGTDNVITCGSFTTDGSGNATVTLGYEPQWILTKRTDSSTLGQWYINDNMRGMPVQASAAGTAYLTAESSSAEYVGGVAYPTATGFQVGGVYGGQTNIYIAIRRGPMKTPTDATKVFSPIAANNSTNTKNTTNFPVDLQLGKYRTIDSNILATDRLRGISTDSNSSGQQLRTNTTSPEDSGTWTRGWDNTGFLTPVAYAGTPTILWNFQRAPGFFDEVCYTGTGTGGATFSHNLTVVPEFMIVKNRTTSAQWLIYQSSLGNTQYLLFTTGAAGTGSFAWNNTSPTSTIFTVGTSGACNTSGENYVAYLFATLAGVSKVGSYTGNGTTQTINCGFTGGARFVLIKRTDSTGDWYVYDTARGMTTLTDPYLLLNSSAAETATLGSVTTVTTGFALNSTILADINISAASYIFLAIA